MSELDQVATHLQTLGLHFEQLGQERIALELVGDNARFQIFILAQDGIVSFVAPGLAIMPEHRVDDAIRLANLLNARRLQLGWFWVEPSQRRLAFEVPVQAPDGVSLEQVRRALSALRAMDFFYPAFARTVWGGMSPLAALGESDPDDRDDGPTVRLVV
jgi:hypothetical protein